MISKQSARNFISMNSFLLLVGTLFYMGVSDNHAGNGIVRVGLILGMTLTKDYLFIYVTERSLHSSPYINALKRHIPSEDYPGEFDTYVIKSAIMESIMIYLASLYLTVKPPYLFDLLLFIPISFMFEIIFDFFHYWSHYWMHCIPVLYKNSHKVHHKFQYPSPITTYYQHSMDILLTNILPVFLTLTLINQVYAMSMYTFCLINMYKTYIEISGHCGKILNTTSFPQCIWLPKLFNIGLRVEDHDLHHSLNNCNYAKRFILWDKAFGTYVSGSPKETCSPKEK